MKKLNDSDYLRLVIDVGNCFVADNAYQIHDDVREATLKVAKHFVSFEKRRKGIGLVGQNGVGKSLLFKIMGEIAPFFGKDFLSVKANMMGVDTGKYVGRDALFVDDIGQDTEVKKWGNTIDMVYSVIDYRATLWENGLPSMFYFTSNLSAAGYKTLAERYDARIFDRLKAMCDLISFGDNDTSSYRAKTRQNYPDKERIQKIVSDFIKHKMGMDFSKEVHPFVLSQIEICLKLLRVHYARALKYKEAGKYLDYRGAFSTVKHYLNHYSLLVYSSEPAKAFFEKEYLNVCSHIDTLEWEIKMPKLGRKSLGQRVKESLDIRVNGNGGKRVNVDSERSRQVRIAVENGLIATEDATKLSKIEKVY